MIFKKMDWDSILSYNTAKIVTIRDKRLGSLHIIFMVLIIVYIVIYSTIYKKGYLVTETPVGSIRASLLAPNEFKDDSNFSYCDDNSIKYDFKKLECDYYDEAFVSFPVGDDVSFAATTRVKILDQVLNCSSKNPKCKYTTLSTRNVYVSDIEDFTILIDHTMFAPSSLIQYNSKQLKGYILDNDNNEIQINEGINTIGIPGKSDILTIGKLLELSNINLDSPSSVNSTNSIRYDGVVALVFITYSNTFSYNTNNFKYVYSIKKVEDTEYGVPEAVILDNTSSRMYYNRHGIRLIFIQNGEIGSFNFQALLLTFVSGLGLLAISTIVVDQLAIRFLPERKTYSSHKFQVTNGFSEQRNKLRNSEKEPLLLTTTTKNHQNDDDDENDDDDDDENDENYQIDKDNDSYENIQDQKK
ncbi:hypothetical protein RB653_008630 [Dictyostelium firmibasis]|uniref:P2X receptor n=1 Tax=Dictyostelium firmibasis TaxID=79012 RepID=A0AAN7U508_9MYCE